MSNRAHVYKVLQYQDTDGSLQPLLNASVHVVQEGANTAISGSLWTSDSGSTTLTNPFVSTDGTVEFYLDVAQRVRLAITPAGGSEFFSTVDVEPGAEHVVTAAVSNLSLGTPTARTVMRVAADGHIGYDPVTPIEVEQYGAVGDGSANDTSAIQAALTAATGGGIVRLAPGKTYRAHGLTVPVGVTLDARGATVKVPSSTTALNILTCAGAWRLIGGTFDGNKSGSTDGGSNTTSCGIYQYAAGGWSGQVRLESGPVFHDFWRHGVRGGTDDTAITDADNAPNAGMFLDGVEVYNCGASGMFFTALGGLITRAPYSHGNAGNGIYTKLCRAPVHTEVRSIGNTNGHGFSSLYCVDQRIDGQFDLNSKDGLVIGGDSTSTTNKEGRRYLLGRIIARYNTSHGVTLDATKTGSNAVVPVYGQVTSILTEHNGADGLVITSSQYVDIGTLEANDNALHGASIATANTIISIMRGRRNGQKALALQGSALSPNNGGHKLGFLEFAGNTPDDTISYGTVLAPSQFVAIAGVGALPTYKVKTAATTRNNTATATDDPDLTFASIQPGTYVIEAFLPYDATTTADIVFGWDLPSGSTAVWAADGPTSGASLAGSAQINRVMSTNTSGGGPTMGAFGVGSASAAVARPVGTLTLVNAGTVALKWAQNVAEVSNCTLEAGAWLKLTQVA